MRSEAVRRQRNGDSRTLPLPNTDVSSLLSARPQREELVGLECFGVRRQLRRARGILTPLQHERQYVGGLPAAQAARIVLWHRRAHPLEQFVEAHLVPIRRERTADERGSMQSPRQIRPVTARTLLVVELFAAGGLLHCVRLCTHHPTAISRLPPRA